MRNSAPKVSPAKRGTFRLSSGKVLHTTEVFEYYWRFASERQEIFFRRLKAAPLPWTEDLILQTYRFTNVYRAADRVSQFLIRRVIYEASDSAEEVFFRILLFKFFNRIDTWHLLCEQFGTPSWKRFDLEKYTLVLDRAMAEGRKVYSPAYIMPCPPFGAKRKHTNHLTLLAKMMEAQIPRQIASAKSLEQVFHHLRAFPSLGNFLAFQFAIDLNYSELTHFSEMDFVVAGPGARSGLRKSFVHTDGLSEEELIREVTQASEREFERRGLRFRTLGGRPLQLIDCQNLFCEIDKYTRVACPDVRGDGRVRIKRRYLPPRDSGFTPPQWYPPKWNIRVDAESCEGHDARCHHPLH